MYKIAIDDGHGMQTAGKRTPVFTDGTTGETGKPWMHENEFNRAVAAYLKEHLIRCGFDVLMVAPTDEDTPRMTRINRANDWGADLYISIHANALNGIWGPQEGVSTFHFPGSVKGQKAAEIIHKYLLQGTKQKDRKVQTAKFDVLRYTYMPAVLVECAFMDNLNEARLLMSDAFRRECAYDLARGICEYFNIQYVETKTYKKVSITGKTQYSTVKRGSKGLDVVALQEQLKDMGYYTGAIDGIFGQRTEDAVRYVQKANDLTIDGIVGPLTWANILTAHVYEVSPLSLRNEIVNQPGNKIKGDFINSVFFEPSTLRSLGNMVQDGKLLAKQWVTHPDTGKPHDVVKRGNLIVYNDGTVVVKMIMDIEKEEDISKIKFAVSGFNMEPLDLKKEWFDPAQVGYTTWRSALGYNPSTKMINAVIMPNCSAERMRKMMDKLGCTLKLGMDSGGSTNGRFAGKDIRLTTRTLCGIIRFG
ncbi:MAG TPA: N-acetylmuramoyl-L-alanine amidase [Spirochaetota bacterium]|nr:N-acetylmuramoyl-L-alanine amidase [Spirochaetota bacterium]